MADKKRQPSSTPSDGPGDQPKVKRMRKGTKSCTECRRRKIKCIFDPLRPEVCNDCFTRGATCIDQEHADFQPKPSDQSQQGLKGRVSQLEDLVRTLVSKLDSSSEAAASKLTSPKPPTPATESDRDTGRASSVYGQLTPVSTSSFPAPKLAPVSTARQTSLGNAPMLSLFDNSIVTATRGWDEQAATATAQDLPDITADAERARLQEVRNTLVSYLPSRSTISKIALNFGTWYEEWTNMMPGMFEGGKNHSLEQFIQDTIRDGSLMDIGRVLLSLSLSLQQMPSDYDFAALNLRLPPAELADFWSREVHRLLLSDDEIAGTLPGIECLIIYMKYAMNAGRPRKAWLAHRRAVTFAQLLSLHHKSYRSSTSDGFAVERKEYVWIDLCICDKAMGLFLGIPYTIAPGHCEVEDESKFSVEVNYMLKLSNISARLIDRNQDLSQLDKSLPVTLAIEEDLQDLARSVDPDWWNPNRDSPAFERNGYLLTQFMHHQTRAFLHLPFMLRSAREKRFQHNRDAAVESSREMMRVYKLLREDRGQGAYICKMADFQAFTAAVLVLLNLYAFSNGRTQDHLDDWELVFSMTELLRSTVNEVGGKVSAQCVRVLDQFTECKDAGCNTECKPGQQSIKITIPFYGTLSITNGADFQTDNAYHNVYPLLTPPAGSDSNVTSPDHAIQEPVVGLNSFNNPMPLDFPVGDFQPLEPQAASQDAMNASAMGGGWDMWSGMLNMDLDHDWNWYMGPTMSS